VTVETKAGPMFRLVDVAGGLSALSYPPVNERVVLEVRDDLRPRNDGCFELAVEDGQATCTAYDGPADLSLDVGRLSQLAVGYRDVSALVDAGQVRTDPETVERVAALFPSVPTFLREGF
jgi:predicted acetyltransferase